MQMNIQIVAKLCVVCAREQLAMLAFAPMVGNGEDAVGGAIRRGPNNVRSPETPDDVLGGDF